MIKTREAIPLSALDSLGSENLVIRPDPKGLVVYLDFDPAVILNRHKLQESFEQIRLAPEPSDLSFSGWVGFFGYEFLAANFNIPLQSAIDLTLPDGWFARPNSILHLTKDSTSIESLIPEREKEIRSILNTATNSDSVESLEMKEPTQSLTCNLDFAQYQKIFEQAREAILDGETYQIKISQRFEATAQINPLHAFEKLRLSNPAPEAFLLQTPDFSIVSCSPEVVIEKHGKKISTRPIGGTYQRANPVHDGSVIERFLRDPKEVAEHNMLVDLERNDLSALCIAGSVRIERFQEVESYSHLHHLVSTISGNLREELSLQEILQGMLPGGSITGCPKARTMEWIDQLEPCFRGPYTGSFGTLEDSGDIRLNLIIRSMISTNAKCYIQAGGGIVVDSNPEYEYNENRIKAQALLDLLR